MLLYLSPVLAAGYYYDDAWTSLLYQYATLHGLGLTDMIRILLESSARQGRSFPGTMIYMGTFWYFCRSLWIYQGIRVLSILIVFYSFARFLKELTSSTRVTWMGLTMGLMLFQLRPGNDPVLAYPLQMHLITMAAFGSVAFFLRYLATGRSAYLVACLLTFVAALTIYEVSLVLYPMLFALALREHARITDRRRRLGLALGTLTGVAVLYLALAGVLRLSATRPYSGVILSWNLRFFPAYFFQLVASLPGSVLLSQGLNGLVKSQAIFASHPWVGSLFGIAATLYLDGILRLCSGHTMKPYARERLVIVGGCLLLLPPVPVALSQKYQGQLGLGFFYLPVMMQWFGLALLLTVVGSGARRLVERHLDARPGVARVMRVAISALLGSALTLQYCVNWGVVDGLNAYWKLPRDTIEAAARARLFDSMESRSIIMRIQPYIFEQDLWNDHVSTERSSFYYALTGKAFIMCDLSSPPFCRSDDQTLSPRYVLYFDKSYAMLAKVAAVSEPVRGDRGSSPGFELRGLRVFQRWPGEQEEELTLPLGLDDESRDQIRSRLRESPRDASALGDGRLLEFPEMRLVLNPESISDLQRSL